jgi:starch-binding outer membrane protein SusE/F
MKSKILHLAFFLFLLVLAGCSKKDTLDHLQVTAVQSLYDPEDNKSIKLTTSGSLVFDWEAAKAEDGGLVMYELAFDKEGGDFSSPIYTLTSDNYGTYSYATIAHTVLDKIAKKAGIGSSETGKIIWTVVASKGINEVTSSKYNTLEVTRLAGFSDDEIPDNLYITGEGSEAGSTLSNAIKMKQTGTGTFEIYTKLTEGKTYYFVSANSGSPTTYYVDSTGTVLKESGTSTASATSVYRIALDFTTGAVVMTEIQKLTYFFSPWWDGGSLFDLDYQGLGVWKAQNQQIEFSEESWGYDQRYKFYFTLGDGTLEWWGSANMDNTQPTSSTASSYYYLVYNTKSADASESLTDEIVYNYTFKFSDDFNGKYVNMTVYFSPDGTYTHKIEAVE